MSIVQWTVLGSGSGIPSKNRACCGHLLSLNGRSIMFDCGSGVMSSYLCAGHGREELEAILISHTHADHITDLPIIIQWLKAMTRMDDLDIYLPEEAIRPINAYLDAVYLFREKLPFRLNLRPLTESILLLGGKLNIASVPNSHEYGNRGFIASAGYPNRMECFSFSIIIEGGRRIFYSADIGSFEEIEHYIQNIDLLVLETSHVDLIERGDRLSESNIKIIILSHIADERENLVRKVAGAYVGRGELSLAEDGLTVTI